MASADEQLPRKLDAILLADVVGYSRLMGQDETGTLTRLKHLHNELIDPTIKAFHGRIVKLMGDGMLVEFSSIVEAVACAVVIQEKIKNHNRDTPESERIELRIGINLGDVLVDGEDIFGDGVNLAARLEGLAESGGICIAGAVYDALGNKLPLDFNSLGKHAVKNISRPVRTYDVKLAAGAELPEPGVAGKVKLQKYLPVVVAIVIVAAVAGSLFWFQPTAQKETPDLVERLAFPSTDKPSIAVLPFSNPAEDPSQQYFADGMTDDLITDLTQLSSLHVISRDSVFRYRGDSISIAQVAQELGVNYILRGSVRRADGQVRINVQLVDTASGTQLWAERYDGDIQDIFKVQDQFTDKIVGALSLKLTEDEQRTLTYQDTNNIDAYERYLRGEGQFFLYSLDGNQHAQKLFEEAIALDDKFTRAYVMLAWTHVFEFMNGWSNSPDKSLELAEQIATHAIDLNDSLPLAYYVRGLVHRERGDYVKALVEVQKTVELDPNYANGKVLLATLLYYAGRPEEGLERIKQAIKLNPHHPYNYPFHLGQAYFVLGRYDEAIVAFNRGLASNPASERLRVWLAAALAQSGNIEDAQWEMEEVRMANPDFKIDRLKRVFPFSDPADLENFMEGLQKAGL
jgi:TolB-like protein/class 3 adenylate cyclase/Tfp pilus assembly protein PilF